MPVDRKIYKDVFTKEKTPQWSCPTCNKGVLHGKKGSFIFEETKSSKDAQSHEAWEPEWIEFEYSCQFICTNPTCKENVASVGTGSVDYNVEFDSDGNPGQEYYNFFEPKFFYPNLNIFKISENTPKDVKYAIQESFKLFFASPSSSSNHLRIALELILDRLKINRYETKNGKRIIISLHRRINLIPNKISELKELFLAIKWLGNVGSHSHETTIDDVMDAFDIFENILDELFEDKLEKSKRLAKQINRKKGHRGKRKKI